MTKHPELAAEQHYLEPWSLAELVLVDEAVARTYGHVVVDEAQDLSAMELRAVARRCPTRSMTIRLDGVAPVVVQASLADLGEAVAAIVREHADAWSSVGVVAPRGLFERVEAALAVARVEFGDGERRGLEGVVTVLLPPEAKGLEFDAVVVVEPGAFLDDGAVGGRLLYIALTGAVQALTIVHTGALADELVA